MSFGGTTDIIEAYNRETKTRSTILLKDYVTTKLEEPYMDFRRADYYSLVPQRLTKTEAVAKCESGEETADASANPAEAFQEQNVNDLL
jgi:hypothetical protein